MMNMLRNYSVLFKLLLIFALSVSVSVDAYSASTMDLYKELMALDKAPASSRQSYKNLGQKFYNIYKAGPTSRGADEALLGTARVYRRSYERYKIAEDLDTTLRYYTTLQGAFDSAAAREAYLEASDIFKLRGDYSSARFTLNKLVNKHPDTSQARTAIQKLNALGTAPTKPTTTAKPSTPSIESITKGKTNLSNIETAPAPTPAPTPVEQVRTVTPTTKPTGEVTVQGVRYYSDKDYTRVVIEVSEPAEYESRWLRADPSINKPSRLFVDVNSSKIAEGIDKDQVIKDGLLSAVRLGYHAPEKRTRVVLDSQNVKDFTVFQLINPSRIVIDVYSEDKGFKGTSNVATGTVSPPKTSTTTAKPDSIYTPKPSANDNTDITLGAALGLKIKTIVIDAGHGGKDPGAVSNGIHEKELVLDIAKKVYNLLKKDKSLNVYMTRSTDKYLELEERTAIANKYKADLFISIHANAARNTTAQGVETFVFNVTNDKAALEVAALENQATTKSISDLQGILKDILKYSKLEESLVLASYVQRGMVGSSKAQDRGVKQAPFYVLVGATMPAVLIEVGFVSNKNEANKLKTASHRNKVADGIYKGLKDYIAKYNN